MFITITMFVVPPSFFYIPGQTDAMFTGWNPPNQTPVNAGFINHSPFIVFALLSSIPMILSSFISLKSWHIRNVAKQRSEE